MHLVPEIRHALAARERSLAERAVTCEARVQRLRGAAGQSPRAAQELVSAGRELVETQSRLAKIRSELRGRSAQAA